MLNKKLMPPSNHPECFAKQNVSRDTMNGILKINLGLCSRIIFLLFFFNKIFSTDKADLIVYSYHRPLQLFALLESVEKYILNLGEVHIIYRCDNEKFCAGYEQLISRFNKYFFHKQGKTPALDFKVLTLKYFNESSSDYVVFAVDDIVVKDYFDISQCVSALKKTNSYAFFLRLGMNIKECYMRQDKCPLPKHNLIENYLYLYNFSDGQFFYWCPWAYPNNVDMTIYKKSEIKNDLEKINMTYPNDFEFLWANLADYSKKGLFFKDSKIVNIPINVTPNSSNRNMKLYSIDELLEIFNLGLKIDISLYNKFDNKSPHVEIAPEFIKR